METSTGQAKGKGKKLKKMVLKTLSRCRTLNNTAGRSSINNPFSNMVKSKSWHAQAGYDTETCSKKPPVAPEGCFTVYVGPEKERFVIKMKYINHPLFKMLLEEAETEYGYCCEGPLALPCEVQLFHYLLWEMSHDHIPSHGCNFAKTPASPCYLFNPSPV